METVEQIKGAKYDDGKLRLSLVPPEIVTAVAEVREFGKRKYADAEDWRSIEPERWHEALLRHALAMWNNPLAIDEESGLPVIWHVATNAAFLCAAYKDELVCIREKAAVSAQMFARKQMLMQNTSDKIEHMCNCESQREQL